MTFETDSKTEVFDRSRRDRKRVEILFAHLKRIFRLGRLRLRGPCGAQFEFTLGATAQNLRRLAKLVVRPPPVTEACFAFSGNSAQRLFWTALRLEEAAAAVACLVEKCIPMIDQLARRSENLAGRTNVNVLLLVKAEVLPTEGSIPPEYAAPSSYP